MKSEIKKLSKESYEELKSRLIFDDLSFAARLNILQDNNFPRRLKNIGEWSEAEKIKRLIIGLHDNKSEVSGGLDINITRKIVSGEAG